MNSPIQAIKVQRLYLQVAQQLQQLIASGEFEVGRRLPAERDLASQFGVSRPTIREAMIALEIAGLVEVRSGSGVYVTGQKIQRKQEMDSIDLLPLLQQKPGAKGHEVLVHYSSKGQAALRQGDWKLHVFGKNLKNLKPTQLYNLAKDPMETNDLAGLNNIVFKKMKAAIGLWQKSVMDSLEGKDYER